MVIRVENIGSKEPATKGDLEDLREDQQAEMAQMEHRITGRIADLEEHVDERSSASEKRMTRDLLQVQKELTAKLEDWGRILFDKIDEASKNRMIELGGADTAHVSLLDDKIHDLDARVATLESHRE